MNNFFLIRKRKILLHAKLHKIVARRVAEWRLAVEREESIRRQADAERERRLREIREREADRRRLFEERRRALEKQDNERRQKIMAKYNNNSDAQNHQRSATAKKSYAFGSSTPRTLAYLEHLGKNQRVYDVKLRPSTADVPRDDSSSAATTPTIQPPPVKRTLATPNRENVSRPSTRGMSSSMYTPSPRLTKNLPEGRLLSARSVKSVAAPIQEAKTVRPASVPSTKMTKFVHSKAKNSVDSDTKSVKPVADKGRHAVTLPAKEHPKIRPVEIKNGTELHGVRSEQSAVLVRKKMEFQREKKQSSELSNNDSKTLMPVNERRASPNSNDDEKTTKNRQPTSKSSAENGEKIENAPEIYSDSLKTPKVDDISPKNEHSPRKILAGKQGDDGNSLVLENGLIDFSDDDAIVIEDEPVFKEKFTNDVNEDCIRLERDEQLFTELRKAEEERLRMEEGSRIEEAKQLRIRIQEEERSRRQKMEKERLDALERARLAEEDKLRRFAEEEGKRRAEEQQRKDEAKRKQIEMEARLKEQQERLEREKREAEDRSKREEEARQERKRKLDAIMQRTRNIAQKPTVQSNNVESPMISGSSQSVASNGFGCLSSDSLGQQPDSIRLKTSTAELTNQRNPSVPADQSDSSATPASVLHSSSATVLQKYANSNSELGRSVSNILAKVKRSSTSALQQQPVYTKDDALHQQEVDKKVVSGSDSTTSLVSLSPDSLAISPLNVVSDGAHSSSKAIVTAEGNGQKLLGTNNCSHHNGSLLLASKEEHLLVHDEIITAQPVFTLNSSDNYDSDPVMTRTRYDLDSKLSVSNSKSARLIGEASSVVDE